MVLGEVLPKGPQGRGGHDHVPHPVGKHDQDLHRPRIYAKAASSGAITVQLISVEETQPSVAFASRIFGPITAFQAVRRALLR